MEKPNPRFKVGETVYVSSRYDGIVPRVIQSIVSCEDQREENEDKENWVWTYELDRPVQIRKDGDSIGVKTSYCDEDGLCYWTAPEFTLMLLGDKIFSTHWLLGGVQDEILSIDKINETES